MTESLLIAALLATVVLLVRSAVGYARYRAVFRYDEEDLERARADAARRSRSARSGRAAEQLAPLGAEFSARWDPADARFVGAPVDFVVFDGLCAGALRELVLVEVKSGRGSLSTSERQVREAVEEGRLRYELLRV